MSWGGGRREEGGGGGGGVGGGETMFILQYVFRLPIHFLQNPEHFKSCKHFSFILLDRAISFFVQNFFHLPKDEYTLFT